MFRWIKLEVQQLPLSRLSGGACKVFLALASIVDERGYFSVTYEVLHKSLQMSRRTAIRHVVELERRDVLWRTNVPGQCLTGYFKKAVSVGRGLDPKDKPLGYERNWDIKMGAIDGT